MRRTCWRTAGPAVIAFALALTTLNAPSDRAQAAPLPFDPQHAPIVFIPGLTASELGCGLAGLETNIWPRRSNDPALWALEMRTLGQFEFLGLVDVDPGPGIDTRPTGSPLLTGGCGEVPFGGGTVAAFDPKALHPLWCLPEVTTNPVPVACPSGHENEYAGFALAMQAQIAANGRGQNFVSFAWDWRLSPAQQVAALNTLIENVTNAAGVKATVVAHSFGNTMFREWANSQGAAAGDRVGRFLSVAGPWWGVATSWTHPAFGQIQPGISGKILSIIADIQHVQSVFQSSPGIYWLMPTPEFNDLMASVYGGGWLSTPVAADPAVSQWIPYAGINSVVDAKFTMCPQAGVFDCPTKELYDLARAGTPAAGFQTHGINEWVGLAGGGVETPGQICSGCSVWPDGSTRGTLFDLDPAILRRVQFVSGDGNVPLFSAIQGTNPADPAGDDVPFFFTCNVSHMDLMRRADVLSRTLPYLTGDAPLRYDTVLTREACVPFEPTFTG